MPTTTSTFRRSHWLVLLLTFAGFAIRIWGLSSLPPQAWYDEIWFAARARDLVSGAPWVAHYGLGNTAGNAGLVYLTALVNLLGIHTVIVARIPVMLAGVLSIPLAYVCLRELTRRDFPAKRNTIAFIGALAVCVTAFMVILSRIGVESALAPPVALFAIWQMSLAARRGGWHHWALAGLVSGLAQYNGPHARFILPLMIYWAVELFLLYRDRRRSTLIGLASLAAVGIAVNVPLILTFVQHPDWLVDRAQGVSADVNLLDNIIKVLMSFGTAGDLNPRHNLPGRPMLDAVQFVAVLIGLLWALRNSPRRPLARLLIVWLVIMMVPSILTAEAPNMQRMIGVIAPLGGLMGIGFVLVSEWAKGPSDRMDRPLAVGGVLALLISSALHLDAVFNRWPQTPGFADAFTTQQVIVARDLATRAQDGEIVIVDRRPGQLDPVAYEYYFPGLDIPRVDFQSCLPFVEHVGKPATLVILAENNSARQQIAESYGDQITSRNEITLSSFMPTVDIFQLAPDAAPVNVQSGTPITFNNGISLNSSDVQLAEGSATLLLEWHVASRIDRELRVFIHVQPSGVDGQPPVAQSDSNPCGETYRTTEWLPGIMIRQSVTIQLPSNLPTGEYDVVAGLYDPVSGERVHIVQAASVLPGDRAVIGRFGVK